MFIGIIKQARQFNSLDIFKLVFAITYIITVGAILVAGVEVDESIQNWMNMLTHIPGIALIVVTWSTPWVSITLGIGLFFSVLSHGCVIADFHVHRITPLDISFANLSLLLIAFIIVFQEIPTWALPVLFTTSIVDSVFWDVEIVYVIIGGLTNALVLIFVITKLIWPTKHRNTSYLLISLLIGVVGSIFFLNDGNYGDKNYAIMHSVWHVCSYTALYFAIRSINTGEIRRPRIEFSKKFNLGKIAMF